METTLPPTPPSPSSPDPTPQSQPAVDFSPATVPYSESFENDLMNLILHPPSHTSPPQPPPNATTLVLPASLLPIPLSSPLRTHASPIPGLFLTHANGYHTGGPGPSYAKLEDFKRELMLEVGNGGEMDEAFLRARMEEKMCEIRERMEEREKAVERNRGVEEELEKLRLQRDAEVRVLEKMKGRR